MSGHREAAIHCEMKKCALRQSKDGIIVSFVLHPNDVPKQLQTAEIGSRWMVALVELADDESPVHQPAKEHLPSRPKATGGSWQHKRASAQAAILCDDAVFRRYLSEQHGFAATDKDTAAVVVRQLCQVESRKQFDGDAAALERWQTLQGQYLAWKMT